MSKSHSVDFSEGVLQYLEKNKYKRVVSLLFQVEIATIYCWISSKKIKRKCKPSQPIIQNSFHWA